jgi:predicted CXXCH cytochrome family protein
MAVGGRWWAWCVLSLLSCCLNAAPLESANAVSDWDEEKIIEHADEIPQLIRQHEINADELPYPHWREGGCRACHLSPAPQGNDAKLRSKDINGLCNNCHETVSVHNYIHAVGMEPSAEKGDRMSEQFRQAIKRGDRKSVV